jgi:predicted transposase YbfD/YdcC
VPGKSNEIIAILELLDALYIKGFLVSIDAIGCQKRIACLNTIKGGDYLLMVKGNQPSLLNSIETPSSTNAKLTMSIDKAAWRNLMVEPWADRFVIGGEGHR